MPTIKEATKNGILNGDGDRPDLRIWELTLDDGRKAEILRKLDNDSNPPSGEVSVEDTKHGLKAKLVQQQRGGKDYKADDRGLRGKNASMAVSYAKDLVLADKIELAQLSLYAEKFYGFIESKAKVGD